MENRTVPCRVCGKLFVPCNKSSRSLGAFNYRSVACSPECGAEYLRRVQAARNPVVVTEDVIPDAIVSTDQAVEEEIQPTERTVRKKIKQGTDEE
jgi:hypothetical protein